jgi:uncharacterized membrane protein
MAFVGRLHPMLIHFPIALVIAAALAEGAAIVTADEGWRTVAVRNVRAGAVFALLATVAGWRLALAPGMELSPLVEWHRWLGTVAAGVALAAALAAGGVRRRSALSVRIYRIALCAAGILVAVTGHVGGLLVWGANFLRP